MSFCFPSLLCFWLCFMPFLLLRVWVGGDSAGGFGSLAEVALLFQKDEALLAGWIHYLAFDLFVGMWEASDAAKRNINRWLLLPCLILTFMLGPIGLLLYFIIRGIASKNVLQNPFAA